MKDFKTCMKGLWTMFRPVRGKTLVSVLLGTVRIAASLGFVMVSKTLVDIVTKVVDKPLWTYVALLAGILLVQILVNLADNWWASYFQVKTQNDLRKKTFAHVLRSEWQGRERFLSGDTVNRLEEDIRVVSDLLCSRIPGIIITLLQLLAASVYLMTLAPNLLWVLLILMGVMVFGSRLFFKVLRRLTAAIRAKESELQQLMQENLQNRVLVLTLTGVERVMERFGWLQQDVVDNTVKRLNYNAVARGLMLFGFQAGHAAAFLWGIFGIRAGTVTYGMMTAFLQLVGQVQRPIAEVGRQIPAFIHALTSIERLMELEELPEEPSGDPVLIPGAPEITVEHVVYHYPDQEKRVLDDFSCVFPGGTMTVIAGPTGVGKSTLIRLILGLLKPLSGTVKVGGHPAGADVRNNFMYIPQGNSLLSGTIRDNLLMADPEATQAQMEEVLETAAAEFVLALPDGLDTKCGEVGSGLSEGQSQRIAIARALLRKGGVLILDEATSALDAATELRLLENLHARYHGEKTILFISHRDAVVRFADAIVRI